MSLKKGIFKEGTRKNTLLKAIAAIVLSYFGIMLLLAVPGISGHVDFPCSASISEDGCLQADFIDKLATKNIEVFLSTYYANAYGGGCLHEASDTGEITARSYSLQREGEKLVIDGAALEKNESWEHVRTVSFWNPWRVTKEKISLTNHGVITCVKDSNGDVRAYGPALVAIGNIGTYYEVNYIGISIGIPVCIVMVGFLVKLYSFSKVALDYCLVNLKAILKLH
jgi:hypothetical protein